MKFTHCLASVALVSVLSACGRVQHQVATAKGPVDYVNPYMGNISHLLVPTFPTIHFAEQYASCLSGTGGLYNR